MSTAREAFYLPIIFLTVALLGGVRLAEQAGAPNAAAALAWKV